MAIVIDAHSLSESSWIEETYPAQLDQAVGPADDFTVRFTRALATGALVSSHFSIIDAASGSTIPNSFRDIALHNDYNNVSLTLTLHLSQALDPDSEYIFYIDGLYDAAGNDQDLPHAVSFRTEDVAAIVPPEVTDESVIAVENHSIANAGIELSEEIQAGSGGHTAYMDPTDGAYNIDANTPMVYVTFSPADVTDADVVVQRRQIAWVETSWQTVGSASSTINGTSKKLEITLPAVSTDVYIEPGYEYKFSVTATEKTVGGVVTTLNESFEFQVMGELEYMFTSVASVLMQYPGWASYDVARLIYINSSRAVQFQPSQASTLTRAGEDYALYATLWKLSLVGSSDSAMIMLGDLQVQAAQGSTGLSGKWEELMNLAESRLLKANPQWARKGSAYTSPFAGRNWDDTISPSSGTYTGIGTGEKGNKPRINLTD